MGWLLWLLLAVLLAVGEVLTPGLFFLGPVAIAAVIAAVASLAGVGTLGSLIIFIVCSVGSLAFLRPIADYLPLTFLNDAHGHRRPDRPQGARHEAGRPEWRPRPHRRRGVERTRLPG